MYKIKNRIFVEKKLNLNDRIELASDHVHYLKNVLRTKVGDSIIIFNNSSNCLALVENITKNSCNLNIVEYEDIKKETHSITLFFSPIKRSPLELMIQKCSEIGISAFQPVLMDRTNLKKINYERLKLIAIEACEQSNRNTIPEIFSPISFDEMINHNSQNNYLYCSLRDELKRIRDHKLVKTDKIGLIIGPEGDFTNDEINKFKLRENYYGVTLGLNVLKSETAAITASSLIMDQIYYAK